MTGRKRNCKLFCLSFLYIVIFSLGGWLIQRSDLSKKRYDRVPKLFIFLKMPLLSFCIWSKFWFEWKAQLLRAVSAPIHSVKDVTYLLCTCFDFHWASINHGSTVILCPWGAMNVMCNKTMNMQITCTSWAHAHVPLSHWTSL